MSSVVIEKIDVNFSKFKDLRGKLSQTEFAASVGLKQDTLSKIERGERWRTLEKFAEFCRLTNTEPNEFFQIIKK